MKEKIQDLDNNHEDYYHVDIMDGQFPHGNTYLQRFKHDSILHTCRLIKLAWHDAVR